jgi:hypothetical protein
MGITEVSGVWDRVTGGTDDTEPSWIQAPFAPARQYRGSHSLAQPWIARALAQPRTTAPHTVAGLGHLGRSIHSMPICFLGSVHPFIGDGRASAVPHGCRAREGCDFRFVL